MEKSEDNLIAWLKARCRPAYSCVRLGIGDDMAILAPGPGEVLITTDMVMDGVDFDAARHTPREIGRKALAVNLSDCAAMAVRPWCAVVSVALPADWSMEQAQELYLGMEALAAEFECSIVGGDTNSWRQPLAVSVTVLAQPWMGIKPVRRDGVRPGDAICVTGRLGGSIQGHHLTFTPRVKEAKSLAEHFVNKLHAMMDLSDGLSRDGWRMAESSGCGIELDAAGLEAVASAAAREAASVDGRNVLDHVLNDGEDFELLLAVSGQESAIRNPSSAIPVTVIGRAVDEPGLHIRYSVGDRGGERRERLPPGGWQHFVD